MQMTPELFDELARKEGLTFTETEKSDLLKELNSMIRFVDKIKDVDTDGVEELTKMPSLSPHITEEVHHRK